MGAGQSWDISRGSKRVIRGCVLVTGRVSRSRVGGGELEREREVVQVEVAESEIQSRPNFDFSAHIPGPTNFIGLSLTASGNPKLRIEISSSENERTNDLRAPYHHRHPTLCGRGILNNTPLRSAR